MCRRKANIYIFYSSQVTIYSKSKCCSTFCTFRRYWPPLIHIDRLQQLPTTRINRQPRSINIPQNQTSTSNSQTSPISLNSIRPILKNIRVTPNIRLIIQHLHKTKPIPILIRTKFYLPTPRHKLQHIILYILNNNIICGRQLNIRIPRSLIKFIIYPNISPRQRNSFPTTFNTTTRSHNISRRFNIYPTTSINNLRIFRSSPLRIIPHNLITRNSFI